jgi:hypothetical protein
MCTSQTKNLNLRTRIDESVDNNCRSVSLWDLPLAWIIHERLILSPDTISVGDSAKEWNTDCISSGAPSPGRAG